MPDAKGGPTAARSTDVGSPPCETPNPRHLEAFLRGLMDSWRAGNNDAGRVLVGQIEHLAKHIQQLRLEVSGSELVEMQKNCVPDATDQLEAVIEMTEQATNRIMDAAESIETLAAVADETLRAHLAEATRTIYEACNFQDITGQRMRKAVDILRRLDQSIASLVAILCCDDEMSPNVQKLQGTEARPEEHLLSGPQLPGRGVTQEDVDILFDS